MHHLFTDFNLTKNCYRFNGFCIVGRWRRLSTIRQAKNHPERRDLTLPYNGG